MEDSRKRNKEIVKKCFQIFYTEFLKDNKGYSNPIEYIEGLYGFDEEDRVFWAKAARWAGHKIMKRNGVYYYGS